MSKEQQWQEVTDQVARLVDALGMPIDPGIRDTMIALNVLGIHTLASCEGHLDRGIAAPWLDIGDPNARPAAKQAHLKLRAVQQAHAQEVPPEQRYPLMEEAEQAKLEVKRLHLVERLKLIGYLDAFYAHALFPTMSD
ncbi:MAG: hypothetical protein ACJ788_16675 [Ktedonobacteraceae bacterium]